LQAIITKYIGPTNTRPGRVKATAEAGSVTVEWEHGLSIDGNHARAAKALRDKFNWQGRMVGGHLPQKNPHHMCFVFDNDFAVEVEA